MESNILSTIRNSGSISTMSYTKYSKLIPKSQKKNDSTENAVAQIMTLFLPFLKESISDNFYNQLQQKLGTFLREYKGN